MAVAFEPESKLAITGKDLSITFTLTNRGSRPARSVALQFNIGPQALLKNVTPQNQCIDLTCNFGTIETGDVITGQVVITPELGINDVILVSSRVSGLDQESDTRNNETSLTLPIEETDQAGSRLWLIETDDYASSYRPYHIGAGPHTLFIPSRNVLYAYDKSMQTKLWRFDAGSHIGGLANSWNGIVYITTDNGNVVALDEERGTVLWRHDAGGTIWSSVSASKSTVYVGTRTGDVKALDARTGELKWELNVGSDFIFPFSSGDGVLITDTRYIYAFQAATGEQIWKRSSGHSYARVAISNGAVYAAGGENVNALDLATGEVIWKYSLPQERQGYWPSLISKPIIADGLVYILAEHNRGMYALQTIDGTLAWHREGLSFDYNYARTPVHSGGTIYSVSGDGYLYALNASNGQVTWRFYHGAGDSNLPHLIVDGDVLYLYQDNYLYSLRAK